MTTPPTDPFTEYEKRRRLFLDEWTVGVHSLDEDVRSSAQGAIEIAQTSLRAGLMLNGGALVLVPGYLALVRGAVDERMHGIIVVVVGIFIFGLLVSWLAAIFGYFTMVFQGKGSSSTRNAAAARIHKLFEDSFPGQHPFALGARAAATQQTADQHDRDARKSFNIGECLRLCAIIANVAGFSIFAIGCAVSVGAVW